MASPPTAAPPPPGWTTLRLAGRSYRVLDFDHPATQRRVQADMAAGVEVYYDRRFRLTRGFCRWLLHHPEVVRDRTVLIAGAGVGLETVVVGRLARTVHVNDLAPGALTLALEQLEANGVGGAHPVPGPCQEAPLDGVERVVACFMVYDAPTRDAVTALVGRALDRGVPMLLANEDIGGFFDEVLEAVDAAVVELARPGRGRVVGVGLGKL